MQYLIRTWRKEIIRRNKVVELILYSGDTLTIRSVTGYNNTFQLPTISNFQILAFCNCATRLVVRVLKFKKILWTSVVNRKFTIAMSVATLLWTWHIMAYSIDMAKQLPTSTSPKGGVIPLATPSHLAANNKCLFRSEKNMCVHLWFRLNKKQQRLVWNYIIFISSFFRCIIR